MARLLFRAQVRNRRSSALALALLLAVAGCRRKETVNVKQTDEEGPRMASVVHTSDPQSDTQLVAGFYAIEQNSWRWTAQRFSVVLRPPAGAAERGATLNMQLTVPDAVISRLKTISVSGNIGATQLSPETYTEQGPYTYTRDIPASLLNGEALRIDFKLDKSLPPGTGGDQRELGVIVSSVGLEAK
jgi:hypothetical protein